MLARPLAHIPALRAPALLAPRRYFSIMPSSDPNAKNASGLTPHETKSLSERQPEDWEKPIVQSMKELYTSQPKESTYQVYAKEAVFHDPIGIAEGIDSIRKQFNGLVKLFPRADLPKFRVLENPPSVPKSTILIDQDVAYFRDPRAAEPTKTVNSLLTIETNAAHQIVRHTEEWDHKRETSSADGFFGTLNEYRKKLTANTTGAFLSTKPPTEK
ncbi:nuclear transport factor 2 family protein [Phanerochaete sordida]|uniref:Nuclear transport factor 2 family protein n=1 Tax=Phanerochaete sordida TaxID=48140 RepID=A0A9P3G5J6_9APHY|nr:nuclear transport factor 2 family protein [Phanerochaete sordida]